MTEHPKFHMHQIRQLMVLLIVFISQLHFCYLFKVVTVIGDQ